MVFWSGLGEGDSPCSRRGHLSGGRFWWPKLAGFNSHFVVSNFWPWPPYVGSHRPLQTSPRGCSRRAKATRLLLPNASTHRLQTDAISPACSRRSIPWEPGPLSIPRGGGSPRPALRFRAGFPWEKGKHLSGKAPGSCCGWRGRYGDRAGEGGDK